MYLYGASGHGKVIAEIAEDNGCIIDHFIDKDPSKKQLLGYKVIHEIPQETAEITISIGNNVIRKKIAEQNPLWNYIALIHPKAIISKRSEIAEGSVIMAGVTINSETRIGKHCIINTNASIDHDCQIEDYAHISPGTSIAGNVSVGEGTHIGIGASIIQGVKIGKWCMIGAGAVIIKDIPDGATVVGNPGRIIKIAEL